MVLDDDLVLARLYVSCKDKDVVLSLFFASLDLWHCEGLASVEFSGKLSLRQVANEHLLLGEGQVFSESLQPVYLSQGAETLSKIVLHTLRYSKHSAHGTLSLFTEVLLDLTLIKEEVEHCDLNHADSCVLSHTAKNQRQVLIL